MICVKCKVKMKVARNGVILVRSEKNRIISFCDTMACPSCGFELIFEPDISPIQKGSEFDIRQGIKLNDFD